MTTQYIKNRGVDGYNNYGLPVSDTKFSATVAATTDTTVSVPGKAAIGVPGSQKNKYLAVITLEWGTDIWFAVNETAAGPAGGSFASTTSEQITSTQDFARTCETGDVLHFFSPSGTVDVSVAFYSIPCN